jgi:hypothetical protein
MIEIFVTHKCSDEKMLKIKDIGIPCIEIDLSMYSDVIDVEKIKQSYETAETKFDGTVKSSDRFRKQVKENAKFVSKNDPKDAPNLMHIGEGESVSGEEAARLHREGKLNVSPGDLEKILANPDAKIDIKSLFGADNFALVDNDPQAANKSFNLDDVEELFADSKIWKDIPDEGKKDIEQRVQTLIDRTEDAQFVAFDELATKLKGFLK